MSFFLSLPQAFVEGGDVCEFCGLEVDLDCWLCEDCDGDTDEDDDELCGGGDVGAPDFISLFRFSHTLTEGGGAGTSFAGGSSLFEVGETGLLGSSEASSFPENTSEWLDTSLSRRVLFGDVIGGGPIC